VTPGFLTSLVPQEELVILVTRRATPAPRAWEACDADVVKVSIPVEKGNEMIKSGLLQQTMQTVMETLKPEAA
jgi:hypothetical protein